MKKGTKKQEKNYRGGHRKIKFSSKYNNKMLNQSIVSFHDGVNMWIVSLNTRKHMMILKILFQELKVLSMLLVKVKSGE